MFADAYEIAIKFTLPIIVSYRFHNGECHCGMGTFVVINNDGWFVTAHHIVEMIKNFIDSNNAYNTLVAQRAAVESDSSLSKGKQMQKLHTMKIAPNAITHYSVFAGWPGVGIGQVFSLPAADLAAGHLVGFNPSMIATYPYFK